MIRHHDLYPDPGGDSPEHVHVDVPSTAPGDLAGARRELDAAFEKAGAVVHRREHTHPDVELLAKAAAADGAAGPRHGRADVDLGGPELPGDLGGQVLLDYTDPDGERLQVRLYPGGAVVLVVAEAGSGFSLAVDLADPQVQAAVAAAVLQAPSSAPCDVCGRSDFHASDCPEAVGT